LEYKEERKNRLGYDEDLRDEWNEESIYGSSAKKQDTPSKMNATDASGVSI